MQGNLENKSPVRNASCASSPSASQLHLFTTEYGPHLLAVNGSRVYQVEEEIARALEEAMNTRDPTALDTLLEDLGLDAPHYINDHPPDRFPMRALSLAIAQQCNLGCTYCYAQGGDFGQVAKTMTAEVAYAAVERLLEDVSPNERVQLSFLGGEPLVNRPVLQTATAFAAERAAAKQVKIGFSLTTNGTLLTPEDATFFEQHGFAVTVSLDGVGQTHDVLRPFKGGQESYRHIIKRVRPLLEVQRCMQVSARVTVTPRNLELRHTLDTLIGLGFHSVGFSPMLSSPTAQSQMDPPQLDIMLQQMITCGQECERQLVARQRYPFSNLINALREIHKGTHRPYPCGAGAGYMGVSADGDLFACHRFVNDAVGEMGSLAEGVNADRQKAWLAERHVHFQEPCRSCWARYLCGGGCHHEVIKRGRPACDYIRGWLDYCLKAYVRILEQRPDYFGLSSSSSSSIDQTDLQYGDPSPN